MPRPMPAGGLPVIGGFPIATTTPTNGQVLEFNSTAGQWQPLGTLRTGITVPTGQALTGVAELNLGAATGQAVNFQVNAVTVASFAITTEVSQLLNGSGTAGLPSYAFTASPTSGVFLVAANNVSITAGGTEQARFNSGFGFFNNIASNGYRGGGATSGTGDSSLLNLYGGALLVTRGVTIAGLNNYTKIAAGTQEAVYITNTAAPASGSTKFISVSIDAFANQTGSANGAFTCLMVTGTKTAYLGSAFYLAEFYLGASLKCSLTDGGTFTCAAQIRSDAAGAAIYASGGSALMGATGAASAPTYALGYAATGLYMAVAGADISFSVSGVQKGMIDGSTTATHTGLSVWVQDLGAVSRVKTGGAGTGPGGVGRALYV